MVLMGHERFLFQGSYGIVKLAYNEEDDTHYVSLLESSLSFPHLLSSPGYENSFQKETP